MRTTTPVAGALLAAALCLAWLPGAWAGMGPHAELDKTTHDFGEVLENRALTHTFVVRNMGDALLHIKHIDSDCACTAAEADRRIPPGGVGRITLTIAPYSVLRQFAKKTTLFLNDPAKPQVVLTLQGYGKPGIDIQPSHILRFRGKPGPGLGGQVRIVSHLPEPWEIRDIRTNIPETIDVRVIPERAGRVYVVEVTNKRREAGNYAGLVELFTNLEKRPRIILRVFGEISSSASQE